MQQLKPILIDITKPEHLELVASAESLNSKPYEVAKQELQELATFYRAAFARLPEAAQTDPVALQTEIISRLTRSVVAEDREKIVAQLAEIFHRYDFVFQDLLAFGHDLQAQLARSTNLDNGMELLYWQDTKELVKYVRPDLHRLLNRSRMLGLVPFETLEKLRNLKIRCIGASVAAQLLDMLGSFGAEQILFADAGNLELSNGPRLTTGMADVNQLGRSKASQLLTGLFHRNPYAYHQAFEQVVAPDHLQTTQTDNASFPLSEFVQNADLIIEVIDSPVDKMKIRLQLSAQKNQTPVLFVADISPVPIAGLEDSAGNYFNQPKPQQAWLDRLTSIATASNPLQQKATGILAITEMLGGSIPEKHLMSTLLIAAGLQPFLSQDPADSRFNAALAARLVLKMLQGEAVTGRNYTTGALEAEVLQDEVNRQFLFQLLQRSLGGN